MLKRIFLRSNCNHLINFGFCIHRNFANDKTGAVNNSGILPGGGLEKLQGGIKEEKYFNSHDLELITKIRKEGAQLKCEKCAGNWAEFEKSLDCSVEPSCCNKNKNCMEEAFFLNEQNENVRILSEKIKNQNLNISQSPKVKGSPADSAGSGSSVAAAAASSLLDKQNSPVK